MTKNQKIQLEKLNKDLVNLAEKIYKDQLLPHGNIYLEMISISNKIKEIIENDTA